VLLVQGTRRGAGGLREVEQRREQIVKRRVARESAGAIIELYACTSSVRRECTSGMDAAYDSWLGDDMSAKHSTRGAKSPSLLWTG
jgi:hypothetical protein